MFVVVFELADVFVTISPPELPIAILLIAPILPLEKSAIIPFLSPEALPHIIVPLTLECGT